MAQIEDLVRRALKAQIDLWDAEQEIETLLGAELPDLNYLINEYAVVVDDAATADVTQIIANINSLQRF